MGQCLSLFFMDLDARRPQVPELQTNKPLGQVGCDDNIGGLIPERNQVLVALGEEPFLEGDLIRKFDSDHLIMVVLAGKNSEKLPSE